MPRNARQSQTRVNARDRGRIGVTDTAGFHANPNLTDSRLGDRSLDNSESARPGLPTFRGRGLRPGVDLDASASLVDLMEEPRSPPDRYPRLVEAAEPMTSCDDPEFHARFGVDLFIAGVEAMALRLPGRDAPASS